MDNKELDKSRAEFEAWAVERGLFLARQYEGYVMATTNEAWGAWQTALARAGTAAPAAPTAELIELCADMVKLHAERGTVLTIHMDELARILAAPAAAVQPSWPATIPTGVWYSAEHDNFYAGGKGMGEAFYQLWRGRSAEFPATATPEQSDTTKGQA